MDKRKKHTILIADDESHILDMYSHMMAMHGYDVMLANDGREALKKIKENPLHGIDLVLLDIIMPDLDGFDVLEKMKKDSDLKRIPVIMLSNLNRQEDIDEAKRLGASDFFVKVKTSPSQLLERINHFLVKNTHEE